LTEAVGIHAHPGRALGVIPANPVRYDRMLTFALTGAVPAHPVAADHLAGVLAWVLGGNNRFGTCVTPDTRVLTADLRWVPVGEVLPGDHLLGFDEHRKEPRGGRDYRRSVVESAERVSKPCYDLVFDDGTKVRCSADHKWLAASTVQGQLRTQQWITTADMKCGPARQTSVVKPADVWETDDSRTGGYLAAAFDGEGCLEQRPNGVYSNRICFVQADNPMLAEVERCLKERDYRFNHDVTSNGTRMRVDGTPRHDKHRISVSPRHELMRLLGSTRPARLLAKFDPDRLGRINGRTVRLVSKTPAGVHEVVKLETSAKTYIAEGLASHNCGPTSIANLAVLTWKALLGEDITVSDSAVFALYRASGNPDFDPTTGAGDNGVDMTVMLDALMKVGLDITHADGTVENVKPVVYGKVPQAVDDIRAVCSIMGGAILAADLELTQQAQTDAGLWDYQAAPEWGGHAFMCGRYTSDVIAHHADLGDVTWAMVVGATDTFVAHQVQEDYAVVFPPLYSHPAFQAGVDQAALAADFLTLTGHPLPLPAPPLPAPPAPVPPEPVPPPPIPPPDIDQAEQDLADALTALTGRHDVPWVDAHHATHELRQIAAAGQVWLADRGFRPE
jgi:hypothetical protein